MINMVVACCNRQGPELGERASCVGNRAENIPGGGNSAERPEEGLCVARLRNRTSPARLPQSKRRGRNGTRPRRKVTRVSARVRRPSRGPGLLSKGTGKGFLKDMTLERGLKVWGLLTPLSAVPRHEASLGPRVN